MVRAVSVSRDADCDGARSVVTERAPPLTGSVGYGATVATEHASRRRAAHTMHRYGEASAATERRRQQRRLRITTAAQRKRPSIATARAAQALWRKKCIATARAATNPSNARDRGCIAMREQARLLIAWTKQRQRPSRCIAPARAAHTSVRWSKGSNRACIAVVYWQPDGESSADNASLRRSNGSHRACIATARAAQTKQCAAEQRQRQSVHRDGESSADYASMHRFCGVTAATDGESSTDCASLWRSYGNDRACIATARAAHNEDCLGF